ncbi:MAG: hypothetical protein AAFX06_10385 [Planctomycetota bacterium]
MRPATLFLVSLLVLEVGCGVTADTESPSVEESGFEEQLTVGRLGAADRIEIARSTIRDEDLDALSVDDVWLETLIVDSGVVGDRGAAAIVRLPSLIHLRLRESPLTDDGMRLLATCESLRVLNLPQCGATAEGVRALSELPKLRNLRIGGTALGRDTAAALASIKTLRQIHLIGVPIDDEGLKLVANLPNLESLYVDDGSVSPAGWDWLFETYPDLHVHVNQQHLDRQQDHHP